MEFTIRPFLNFFPVFVLKLSIKGVTGGGNGQYSVMFATVFLETFSLHIFKKRFQEFSYKSKFESSGDCPFLFFLNCGFNNGFFPISRFPLFILHFILAKK